MNKDLSKYTDYWFENASLDELEEEREYVRSEIYCGSDSDYDTQCEAQELLWKFDDYIREKRYGKDFEWEAPKSTKHGWYLPDDD